MNDQTFLQVQAIELQRLLDSAGSDPILGPQLRERLDDAQRELQAAKQQSGTILPKETPILPRAAVFLRGGGVKDSMGISPSLAGEALIQYEKMFVEQALHDERESAKKAGRQRRPRGATTPGLLFTGTPRGSFGLEFVPQTNGDDSLLAVHAQSLNNIAKALVHVSENDQTSLDVAIKSIPPRVLQPLKQFLKTLAQHGAELRLAFPSKPSQSLTGAQIKNAADRLEKEMQEETVDVPGTFRGVTRESGFFDLKTDDGSVITGIVADNLTEEDLARLHELTNDRCVARIQKTIIKSVSGSTTTTYVLLDAVRS